MARSERELARREHGAVSVKPDPLRVRWRLNDLTSADGHTVNVAFACSVRALDNDIEQRMLAETLLADRDAIGAEDVAGHFAPALRSALLKLVAQQTGERWLDESAKVAVLDALREAAKPVAFACGVEVLPPFDVAIESPTLAREKIEDMQRRLAERRAAGQIQHVQRSAELLKQFQGLRDAAPGLSPGEVLERVNPADRGSMLETLLLTGEGAG